MLTLLESLSQRMPAARTSSRRRRTSSRRATRSPARRTGATLRCRRWSARARCPPIPISGFASRSADVRLHLKLGDFARAAATADSVLRADDGTTEGTRCAARGAGGVRRAHRPRDEVSARERTARRAPGGRRRAGRKPRRRRAAHTRRTRRLRRLLAHAAGLHHPHARQLRRARAAAAGGRPSARAPCDARGALHRSRGVARRRGAPRWPDLACSRSRRAATARASLACSTRSR